MVTPLYIPFAVTNAIEINKFDMCPFPKNLYAVHRLQV